MNFTKKCMQMHIMMQKCSKMDDDAYKCVTKGTLWCVFVLFTTQKKEQPIFQGCPFILSNPTRQILHCLPSLANSARRLFGSAFAAIPISGTRHKATNNCQKDNH